MHMLHRTATGVWNAHSMSMLPCCCFAVDLRETCQAGDATVSASNESTRDSIFRAAVNMALKAALQENAKLAGLRPQQFVGGIARDLGAPPVSFRALPHDVSLRCVDLGFLKPTRCTERHMRP
jgi:hypothetical protein